MGEGEGAGKAHRRAEQKHVLSPGIRAPSVPEAQVLPRLRGTVVVKKIKLDKSGETRRALASEKKSNHILMD
jgi:hypothetical protein